MIWGLQCLVFGVVTHLTKGKAYSIPYASNGSCRNNTREYFNLNQCCSRCEPGSRAVAHCTDAGDTVCEPCQNGTYSENFNYHHNCFKCSKCQEGKGLIYVKQCTGVSDAVCECKPGMHCQRWEGMTCAQCKKIKVCPPGQGIKSLGTARSINNCAPCPEGSFSAENSILPCQPHTRCDVQGRRVLHSGTSVNDTICDTASSPGPTTPTVTPGPTSSEPTVSSQLSTHNPGMEIMTVSLSISKFPPNDSQDRQFAYWTAGLSAVAAVSLLVLLTMTFVIRHRKDLTKPPIEEARQISDLAIHHNHTDCQCLLGDSKTEPSTSSSDSHSQMELSHGRSTGGVPDCGHPELSSPCVNLSITATFNCQLNSGSGSCSVPVGPPTQPPGPPASPGPPVPDLPLSQEEELCSSCQPEESQESVWLAQESGKTMY